MGLAQGVFCAFPGGETWRGPVWPRRLRTSPISPARTCAPGGAGSTSRCSLLASMAPGTDMNEPTVFGPVSATLPDCVRHDWDGRGADHAQRPQCLRYADGARLRRGLAGAAPGQTHLRHLARGLGRLAALRHELDGRQRQLVGAPAPDRADDRQSRPLRPGLHRPRHGRLRRRLHARAAGALAATGRLHPFPAQPLCP